MSHPTQFTEEQKALYDRMKALTGHVVQSVYDPVTKRNTLPYYVSKRMKVRQLQHELNMMLRTKVVDTGLSPRATRRRALFGRT